MDKVDEIFEQLGYTKVIDENHIYYNNLNCGCTIEFDTIAKTVIVQDEEGFSLGIELDELQAIILKAKELGWI